MTGRRSLRSGRARPVDRARSDGRARSSLVGVVSVADDGGSSGRIRRDLDIVAPGDMRRCLAALTPEGLMRDALEHRFEGGVLAGHPAGNVVLAAMLELEPDPVVVMDTLVEMVGARGRVLLRRR